MYLCYPISGLRSLINKQEPGTEFSKELRQLIGLLSPKVYQEVEEQVLNYKNNMHDIYLHFNKYFSFKILESDSLLNLLLSLPLPLFLVISP